MESDLQKLIAFTEFTNEFRKVKRTIYIPGKEEWENDAGHSFQLAMIAWYLINLKGLTLNLYKVIKYALVHDLVETYAEDIPYHDQTKEVRKLKQAEEHKSANKIKQKFPDFLEMHNLIQDYENKLDAESRFVYALDKVLPVINIYLNEGRNWKEGEVTLKMVRTKDPKVAQAPELEEIWQQLTSLLSKQESDLFYISKE